MGPEHDHAGRSLPGFLLQARGEDRAQAVNVGFRDLKYLLAWEGKTLTDATGKTSKEANQEVFIFHKEKDDKLKIARYSFSTTNPPKA